MTRVSTSDVHGRINRWVGVVSVSLGVVWLLLDLSMPVLGGSRLVGSAVRFARDVLWVPVVAGVVVWILSEGMRQWRLEGSKRTRPDKSNEER